MGNKSSKSKVCNETVAAEEFYVVATVVGQQQGGVVKESGQDLNQNSSRAAVVCLESQITHSHVPNKLQLLL